MLSAPPALRPDAKGIFRIDGMSLLPIAKVAMARKLAVRLYWMWRNNWQYAQLVEFGSNAGKLGTVHGVK